MINHQINTICYGAQTLSLNNARQVQNIQIAKKQSSPFENLSFAASLNDICKKTPEINFTLSAPATPLFREELGQLVSTKPQPKRRQPR